MKEVGVGAPGPGGLRLRQAAVGINFSETWPRAVGSATHGHEEFPIILGREAASIAEKLGPGVEGLEIGQHADYGPRRGRWGPFASISVGETSGHHRHQGGELGREDCLGQGPRM